MTTATLTELYHQHKATLITLGIFSVLSLWSILESASTYRRKRRSKSAQQITLPLDNPQQQQATTAQPTEQSPSTPNDAEKVGETQTNTDSPLTPAATPSKPAAVANNKSTVILQQSGHYLVTVCCASANSNCSDTHMCVVVQRCKDLVLFVVFSFFVPVLL
jgi:hypothetical protein